MTWAAGSCRVAGGALIQFILLLRNRQTDRPREESTDVVEHFLLTAERWVLEEADPPLWHLDWFCGSLKWCVSVCSLSTRTKCLGNAFDWWARREKVFSNAAQMIGKSVENTIKEKVQTVPLERDCRGFVSNLVYYGINVMWSCGALKERWVPFSHFVLVDSVHSTIRLVNKYCLHVVLSCHLQVSSSSQCWL